MPDRPRVLVTRPIPDAGLSAVRGVAEVDLWDEELPPPRDVLLTVGEGGIGVHDLEMPASPNTVWNAIQAARSDSSNSTSSPTGGNQ